MAKGQKQSVCQGSATRGVVGQNYRVRVIPLITKPTLHGQEAGMIPNKCDMKVVRSALSRQCKRNKISTSSRRQSMRSWNITVRRPPSLPDLMGQKLSDAQG